MAWLPVDSEEFSLETRKASPSHLLTKVESFSMLSKNGISELVSSEFEAGGFKWDLTIYPDGDEVGKEVDHISAALRRLTAPGSHVSIDFKSFAASFLFYFRNWLYHDKKHSFREFSLETRDASPSHLLTKIKSLSLLSKLGISGFESSGFESGGYKWKVKLYPDGDEEGKKTDHISVKLSMVGTSSLPAGWEVTAIFNFFLYNHNSNNYLCFRGKTRRFNGIDSEMRFSNVIDKKTFTEPSNGYVLDDNCVFGAEVFVVRNQRLVESVSVFDPHLEIRKWEIPNFSKYEDAWISEEFFYGGYTWTVEVYPNGYSEARGRYVSIYLHCIDADSFTGCTSVMTSCRFCFENRLNNEKNHYIQATEWLEPFITHSGFDEFKSIGDMYDEGFLVEDCCLLEIQLSILATQEALN